jgi:hypothetical protein
MIVQPSNKGRVAAVFDVRRPHLDDKGQRIVMAIDNEMATAGSPFPAVRVVGRADGHLYHVWFTSDS